MIQQKDVGHVIVGTDHGDAPLLAVDVSETEDLRAGPQVRTEEPLVVDKAEAVLLGGAATWGDR